LDKNLEVEAIGDFYLQGITGFNLDDFDLKTISHLTPEFISKGQNHDQKSDMWQLGVIFYQMNTGKLPFEGQNLVQIK